MKRIIPLTGLFCFLITLSLHAGTTAPAAAPFLGIKIIISSHAYWAGKELGCLPRDKGCCLHFSIDLSTTPLQDGAIIGEITNNPSTGMVFTFNRKTGITSATFSELFRGGKFTLGGPGTMPAELANKLGQPESYSIPAGVYNYIQEGDVVTIRFTK